MSEYKQIKFTDADIVELDDWIPSGEYNPHNVRPWLLHDAGFILCVVFADCLQDALDIAADNDKLERYLVSPEDLRTDYEGSNEHGYDGISHLGNAGEPFDIEGLDFIEVPNPKMSFCALFDKQNE